MSATNFSPSVTSPAQHTRTSCPSANWANVAVGAVARSAVSTRARAATSGGSLPGERTNSERLSPAAVAWLTTQLPRDPVAPRIAIEVIICGLTLRLSGERFPQVPSQSTTNATLNRVDFQRL